MLISLIKALLRYTPYKILRASDENRFQAAEACLRALRARGYAPRLIIDGGANVGHYATQCAAIFPDAHFILIEPQPACRPALEAIARDPRFQIIDHALGEESGELDLMVAATGVTTGAHIATAGTPDGPRVRVRQSRLDALLNDRLNVADRAFLKLDLQGWELHALRGADACLARIEVIQVEVSFFVQIVEPTIERLIRFLDDHGYSLYDIAAIGARMRDNRAHQADFVFVRRGSALLLDSAWN
jgi:FkbM family methyltransferase